ncbi:MAG: ADP-ribosylglycohydrolase family protein [Dehalococcoidia bacterium]
MVHWADLRAKFRGALVGVAVGDALGAPFEGTTRVQPEDLVGLEHISDGLHYTDDTHMTLGVATSLVECGTFDPAHMAATFARNFADEPWRGYGGGPPQVFRLLERGIPWDRASRLLFGEQGSFGNGGAMRVAPVALFAFQDLDKTADFARRSALITHAHELGMEGAALQACAIAYLLQRPANSALDAGLLIASLRRHVQPGIYHEKLERIQSLLPDAPIEVVVGELGNGIAAFESVPTALYAFFRYPTSFSEAIRYAISLGGDTDTIAAMTGALAGAYLGEEAIPAAWRDAAEGSAQLRNLADALLDLVPAHQ